VVDIENRTGAGMGALKMVLSKRKRPLPPVPSGPPAIPREPRGTRGGRLLSLSPSLPPPPPPNYYACVLPSAALDQCLEPWALQFPRRFLTSYGHDVLKRVLRDALPAGGSPPLIPLLYIFGPVPQKTHPHLPLNCF
jgi:hypothetical protein